MKNRSPRLLAGLVLIAASLAVPTVASATPYTVRVEDAGSTLLPETNVTTAGVAFSKDGNPAHTCGANTAGDALQVATAGDWSGTYNTDYSAFTIERIKTSPTYPVVVNAPRYWSYDVNEVPGSLGACDDQPGAGSRILFYTACGTATTGCYAGNPLTIASATDTPRPGVQFAVTVKRVNPVFGGPPDYTTTATRDALAGATVSGGGATATTNAGGVALLTLPDRGPTTLTVTNASNGDVPNRTAVCVTDGADGYCGTKLVADPGPVAGTTTTTAPTPGTTTTPGSTTQTAPSATSATPADKTPPVATVAGIKDGQTFASDKGPRELQGTVGQPPAALRATTLAPDPSGVKTVKIKLTRTTNGGRCQAYSKTKETFVSARCGADKGGSYFTVATKAVWSYLLPFRLRSGRYVLDVKATDGANNTDTARVRGQNRIAFRVH